MSTILAVTSVGSTAFFTTLLVLFVVLVVISFALLLITRYK